MRLMQNAACRRRHRRSGARGRGVLHNPPYTNLWEDTVTSGFSDPKLYVVQTNAKIIERCLLMTTDPGDLAIDPTCGSGTTAFVAEQWGRRWITMDTSRVALTLARQRIMGARYPYYSLVDPGGNIRKDFRYKTVPHITLKSIANNPDIKPGMDRKEINASDRTPRRQRNPPRPTSGRLQESARLWPVHRGEPVAAFHSRPGPFRIRKDRY